MIATGIGVWGNNIPVAWAFDITNFVFWIGIGHAGTLISAILFLFRQKWRTSINRAAEAMTIFAVMCAGIYPGHSRRPGVVRLLAVPYPNQMSLWPNFRSPLLVGRVRREHVFHGVAVVLVFGHDPRPGHAPRSRHARRCGSWPMGPLRLGWCGSARQWHVYERAYLLLAALATPLVLSVHSVVSTDFAVAQLPGWHTTVFPPYFVAGAIFSGFAMVVTLDGAGPGVFRPEGPGHDPPPGQHATASSWPPAAWSAMPTASRRSRPGTAATCLNGQTLINRVWGPYGWGYWIMILCNVLAPQLFWLKSWRTTPWKMLIVGLAGQRGHVDGAIRHHRRLAQPRFSALELEDLLADVGGPCMLAGSFGLFFTLFLLFCRYLPMVAMAEVKQVLPHEDHAKP